MDPRYARFIRWLTILAALAMLVISGHYWNGEKVHPGLLALYDMMILLMSVCVLGMIMWDASEKQKNIGAAVFLFAGMFLMFFVFA